MSKSFNSILILTTLIFLSGCSIQQRVHNKGFHIEWAHSSKGLDQNITKKKNKERTIIQEDLLKIENEFAPFKLVKAQDAETISNEQEKDTLDYETFDCDIIILNNGKEIKAHVLEIRLKEIIYRPCGKYEGAKSEVKRSEVKEIQYPDGTKTVIEQRYGNKKEKAKSSAEDNNSTKDVESEEASSISKLSVTFGIIGLVLTVIPFIFFLGFLSSITAIILGAIGMKGNAKSRKKSRLGLILGLIPLILIILTLVLLIFLFW